MKILVPMEIKDLKSLSDYLSRHEGDIAWAIDDFGDLEGVFEAVFEEKPSKDK